MWGIGFLFLALFIWPTQSFAETSGDFDYILNGNEATITNYRGENLNVVIPSVVGDQNEYTVTAIGGGAFRLKGIESVTIPNTIVTIGGGAFTLNALKKIVLPDSVISIGKNAFSSNQIEEVKLSKSLKDIPNFAFLANKLKSIDIPANIESIQTSAFENNNITNIHIENNNIQLSYGAFAAQTIIKQLIVPSDRILYVKDYIHFQDASSQLTLDHLTIRDLDDSIVYDTENKALIFSSEPKESTFSLFTGTTRYDSFYDISEYGPSGKSYLFFKYTGPVIVNYIDDQGANLAEATRIDGSMGEEYVSAPKEINGYTLKSNAKNATGQFTNKTQYVNYVYEKNTIKEGQVIVKYQDKFRNSLSENEFLTGEIGTSYTTKSKVIDGYKLIAVNGSPNGEFNLEPQLVTYIYEKLNNVAQGPGSSSKQNEKRLTSKKTTDNYEAHTLPETGDSHSNFLLMIGVLLVSMSLILFKKR